MKQSKAKTDRHRFHVLEYLLMKKFDREHLSKLGLICLLNEPAKITDRDKEIALGVIQWLGSNVGRGFLKECGLTFNAQVINFAIEHEKSVKRVDEMISGLVDHFDEKQLSKIRGHIDYDLIHKNNNGQSAKDNLIKLMKIK